MIQTTEPKVEAITKILSVLKSDEAFFSVDEYGPFAIKMKGGKKLGAPGEQYVVPQWQKSKGWMILTAALELSRNQVTHFYSRKKNTAEMIKMADTLRAQYRNCTSIYLSWDAASWHVSKDLVTHLKKINQRASVDGFPVVKTAPLPAGAQFLNVIESVFSGMARAIIHNSDYPSAEVAREAIDRYFLDRTNTSPSTRKGLGRRFGAWSGCRASLLRVRTAKIRCINILKLQWQWRLVQTEVWVPACLSRESDELVERVMVNLLELRDGGRFEAFCKSLLREQYPRFQAYSAPDSGMDGYDEQTETIFQFYYPEGAPRKDKIVSDIRKVLASGATFKEWILVLPKDPTPGQAGWVSSAFNGTGVKAAIWGKTEIERLLRVHAGVRTAFFPTEVRKAIQRLAKGKKPCFGDAEEWQAISSVESQELREMITKLGDESAFRKRRRPSGADYSREYGEFNSHFRLSSYDRLKQVEMAAARQYLEAKLYARRGGEAVTRSRKRRMDGIHAIRNQLNLSESEYRKTLLAATGFDSLRVMTSDQIESVFQALRRKQELFEARRA